MLSALAVAMASVVMSGASSAAQAQTQCQKYDQIKLQEYAGSIINLAPWVGIEKGIFKKYCLEAVLVPIPSAPAGFAAAVQGSVDFVGAFPDGLFVAITKGLDMKIVATSNDTVYYALIVGSHVALSNEAKGYPAIMKDLVGKKIGVNAFGSTTDTIARLNFIHAGLNPNDATWVAYGSVIAGVAALKNRTIDALESYSDGPEITAAITNGKIFGDFRNSATDMPPIIRKMKGAGLVWAAKETFIKANSDVVKRFVAANNEAVEWINNPAHFDEVVSLVGKKTPSPEGVEDPKGLLLARVRAYVPQVSSRIAGSTRIMEQIFARI